MLFNLLDQLLEIKEMTATQDKTNETTNKQLRVHNLQQPTTETWWCQVSALQTKTTTQTTICSLQAHTIKH